MKKIVSIILSAILTVTMLMPTTSLAANKAAVNVSDSLAATEDMAGVVATIGGEKYDSLQSAFTESKNGDVIVLQNDLYENNISVSLEGEVTLDMNGKNIDSCNVYVDNSVMETVQTDTDATSGETKNQEILALKKGKLIIDDSSKDGKTGSILCNDKSTAISVSDADLVIKNIQILANASSDSVAIYEGADSNVSIEGGIIDGKFLFDESANPIIVSGGFFLEKVGASNSEAMLRAADGYEVREITSTEYDNGISKNLLWTVEEISEEIPSEEIASEDVSENVNSIDETKTNEVKNDAASNNLDTASKDNSNTTKDVDKKDSKNDKSKLKSKSTSLVGSSIRPDNSKIVNTVPSGKYYLYPDNKGKKDGEVYILLPGKVDGNGTSAQNAQLRLEKAIEEASVLSDTSIRFLNYFVKFDINGVADTATTNISYDGNGLTMAVDEENYSGHLFQFESGKEYNLSNMNFSTVEENDKVYGENAIRMIGGKATLDNVSSEGTICYELDKYDNFASDNVPLTVKNAPAGSVFTFEVDTATALDVFSTYNKDSLPIANVADAGSNVTFKIKDSLAGFYDIENKDGILYLTINIKYSGKYIFVSNSGDDSWSGLTHFTSVNTLQKAIELFEAETTNPFDAIVLLDNAPLTITDTNVVCTDSATSDIIFKHWDGEYEDSVKKHNITMTSTSLIEVKSGASFTIGSDTNASHLVISGNNDSAVKVTGGALKMYGVTIKDTNITDTSKFGGAIYASDAAKVDLYGVKLGKNYAETGAQVYATGTDTCVTFDENTVIGNPEKLVKSMMFAGTGAKFDIKTGHFEDLTSNCSYYIQLNTNYNDLPATCEFTGIIDGFNGGKITNFVYSYAKDKIVFNNVNIKNTTIGSVISGDFSAGYSLNMTNCTIEDNTFNSNFIYLNGNGANKYTDFIIEKCDFLNNKWSKKGYYLINGAGASVTAYKVVLKDLNIKYNQNANILIKQSFNLLYDNVKIIGNGKNDQGEPYDWSEVKVRFFQNNYSSIDVIDGKACVFIQNSSFEDNVATIGDCDFDVCYSGHNLTTSNPERGTVIVDKISVKNNTSNSGFSGMHIDRNVDYLSYGAKSVIYDIDNCVVTGNNGLTGAGIWLSGEYEAADTTNKSTRLPLRISNSIIKGNISSVWQGVKYDDCILVFEEGNVVDSTTNQTIYMTTKSNSIFMGGQIFADEAKSVDGKVNVDLSGVDDSVIYIGKSIIEPENPKYSTENKFITDATSFETNFTFTGVADGYTVTSANKRIAYGVKAIYLDGVNGSDSNSGLTGNQAKKTFASAMAALKEALKNDDSFNKEINVLNTVSVTDEENWDGTISTDSNVTLKRWPSMPGDLVTVDGGKLSIDNVTFEGFDAKTVLKTADTKLNGGAIVVNSGSLTSAEGLVFNNEQAYELYIKGGQASLTGTEFKDCKYIIDSENNGSDDTYYAEAPIVVKNGELSLYNSEISDINKVYGSIHQSGGTLTIKGCDIHDTVAFCQSTTGTTSNDTGTLFVDGPATTNVINSSFYKTLRTYKTSGVEATLSGIVCKNSSNNLINLSIDNSSINYIDVQNTKLTLGGYLMLHLDDQSKASNVRIYLRSTGLDNPTPIYLNKTAPPAFLVGEKIYIGVEGSYLNNVVVDGDEGLKAEYYSENYVLDPQCTISSGFTTDLAGHDLLVSVKDVYLDGKNGDDSRDGSSPDKAVKTFEKAKEILKANGSDKNGGSNIVICGTVTISEDTEWSLLESTDNKDNMCFENNAGEKWQAKLIKADGGFNGNMIEVKEGKDGEPFTFTMKNIIFDGNKLVPDSWESNSNKQYACIKAFENKNLGGSIQIENCIIQNVFKRFLCVYTPYGTTYNDMNKYKINVINTEIKNNGDASTSAEYLIYANGLNTTKVEACKFTNNNFDYVYTIYNSSLLNYDTTFKDSLFDESYGSISTYYRSTISYDSRIHRAINIDNCDVIQKNEAMSAKEYNNNTRFLDVSGSTATSIKNCEFDVLPRDPIFTADHWIECQNNLADVSTIDSCKFNGFSSDINYSNSVNTGAVIYFNISSYTMYSGRKEQTLKISNSEFTNCYRRTNQSNSTDSIIYVEGSYGMSAYKVPRKIIIDSCIFDKGDDDNPYNSSPVLYTNCVETHITGNTIIKGNHNGYNGSICTSYGCLYVGKDVVFEDCDTVVYSSMNSSYYRNKEGTLESEFDGTVKNCNTNTSRLVYFYGDNRYDVKIDGAVFDNNELTYSTLNGLMYLYNCNAVMSNTKMTNNKFKSTYGLIYMNNSQLTIEDGTSISNNGLFSDTTGSNYKTINLNDSTSSLIMNGGEIKNNFSGASQGIYGGAIYNNGGTVTINGGLIEGNANTSTGFVHGGAIYSNNGTVTINGGKIKDNGVKTSYTSSDQGGAIYLYGSDKLSIGDSAILDGNCSYTGGAIYSSSGATINIDGDVVIKNSTSFGNGGAIYAYSTKLKLGGTAMISNCQSTSGNGGGLFVDNNSQVEFSNVFTIQQCKATNGGGAYIGNGIKVAISENVAINENEATQNGGGLYLGTYGVDGTTDKEGAVLSGGTINMNKALSGGAIYANRALAFSGTSVTGNSTSGEPMVTDDIFSNKTIYLFGAQSNITDTIFLPDIHYPVVLMQSCQGSNVYNLTVATAGCTGYGKEFTKGQIAIKHGPDLAAADAYLSYFTLSNGNFVLLSGKNDKVKQIVLGVSVYIDGENGDDAGNGEDPDHAVKSLERAKECMQGCEGYIYVSGTIPVDDEQSWELLDGQSIKRYTGFAILGEAYEPLLGDIVHVLDGGKLTLTNTIDISSGLDVNGSIVKVDEGGSLVVDGAKLSGNKNVSGNGGAINNEGDVTIKGHSQLLLCESKKGPAIYHNGTSLVLSDKPNFDTEIYLEGASSGGKRVVNVDDSSNTFEPDQIITINMADGEKNRTVVEHSNNNSSLNNFKLNQSVATSYMLVIDPNNLKNMILDDLRCIYVDGNKTKAESGDGATPENAFATIEEVYEALQPAPGSDAISYGMAIIVNPVHITDDISISPYNYTCGTTSYDVGIMSFVRYAQPTDYSSLSGFNMSSNANEMFIVDDGGKLTLNGLEISGHSKESQSDSKALNADGVVDTKAIVKVNDGGELLIKGNTKLFENVSSGNGGAIEIMNGGSAILDYTFITDVSAQNGGAIYSDGYCELHPSVTTSSNTITKATATKGGAFYIDTNGTVSTYVSTYVKTDCKATEKGSAAYVDGIYECQGLQEVNGEAYLANDKFIKIPNSMVNNGNFEINFDDWYEGRTIAVGNMNLSDYIDQLNVNPDITQQFLVDVNAADNKILELQGRPGIYIDGVNGLDTNSGLTPEEAVKSLDKAYEQLKNNNSRILYVVNTVPISSSVTLSKTKCIGKLETNLDDPVDIVRYSKPTDAASLGYIADSFSGALFDVTESGTLTLSGIKIDGHSNGITRAPKQAIAPGITANDALIVVSGGKLSVSNGAILADNINEVASEVANSGKGGAIRATSGRTTFAGGSITNTEAVHGSAAYLGGTLVWSSTTSIGDEEIYLDDADVTNNIEIGTINMNAKNPNGMDLSGNANKINLDMSDIAYNTDERLIASYGGKAVISKTSNGEYKLKKSPLPDRVNIVADVDGNRVCLRKGALITETVKLDDAPLASVEVTLLQKDEQGEYKEVETKKTDANGECTFTKGYFVGEYAIAFKKGSVKLEDKTIELPDSNDLLNTSDFYTVKFDMQGHGTAIDDQILFKGDAVTKPNTPTTTGYNFVDWYTSDECLEGEEYDFTTSSVTKNITLYAKWVNKTTDVTFDNVKGDGTTANLTATWGKDLPAVVDLPEAPSDEYIFIGYFDEDGKMYYDGDGAGVVTWDKEDTSCTLYARYLKIDEPNISFKYSPSIGKACGNDGENIEGDIYITGFSTSDPDEVIEGIYSFDTDTAAYVPTYAEAKDGKAYPVTFEITKACTKGDYTGLTFDINVLVTVSRMPLEPKEIPEANDITYDGESHELVTPGSADIGTFKYAVGEDDVNAPNDGWSDEIPTGVDAGDYYVWYVIEEDDNYEPTTPAAIKVSVKRAGSNNKAPKANDLTYTGEKQELISAGESDKGVLNYALGKDAKNAPEDGWSKEIPTAVDAGDYIVWYKVCLDSNYNEVEPEAVSVTIKKADPIVTAPKANNRKANGTAQELVKAGKTTGGVIYYSLNKDKGYKTSIPTRTTPNVYTVWYKVVGGVNYNDVEARSIDVTIMDTKRDVVLVEAKCVDPNYVELNWNKVPNAKKYVIYGNACGKNNKYKKIATTKSLKYTVKKIGKKKLKKNSSYKFYVVAYTSKGQIKSNRSHILTNNTIGSYGNATKLTVKVKKLTLKVGKKKTIKYSLKITEGKKHIGSGHGKEVAFLSDNPTVATVDKNGVVTAKCKGTAIIYVQEISGMYKAVKVKVK